MWTFPHSCKKGLADEAYPAFAFSAGLAGHEGNVLAFRHASYSSTFTALISTHGKPLRLWWSKTGRQGRQCPLGIIKIEVARLPSSKSKKRGIRHSCFVQHSLSKSATHRSEDNCKYSRLMEPLYRLWIVGTEHSITITTRKSTQIHSTTRKTTAATESRPVKPSAIGKLAGSIDIMCTRENAGVRGSHIRGAKSRALTTTVGAHHRLSDNLGVAGDPVSSAEVTNFTTAIGTCIS